MHDIEFCNTILQNILIYAYIKLLQIMYSLKKRISCVLIAKSHRHIYNTYMRKIISTCLISKYLKKLTIAAGDKIKE